MPFPLKTPSVGTMSLCFFAAYLFNKKTITAASTIKSYQRHVKNFCVTQGCDPLVLNSEALTRVLKGVEKSRPKIRDSRPAFMLPHYSFPSNFQHPASAEACIKMAAVIFGFFGMLRFHVFRKLTVNNLVLVRADGVEQKLANLPIALLKMLIFSDKIIGFLFQYFG